MQPRVELLPWDTEFFGFRVGRIHGHIESTQMPTLVASCRAQQIRCAYLLVESEDGESSRAAEESGFFLTDVRITLEQKLRADFTTPASVVPAEPNDITQIVDIARVSHTDSRFYYDPNFPRERCDALYATWAEKSCSGYADAVFVVKKDQRVAGYITCHDDKDCGRIGLVGVADWARGGGVGTDLVKAALSFFSERKLPIATVVTQGRNIGAQRLYQRNGFVTRSLELWFHRWF